MDEDIFVEGLKNFDDVRTALIARYRWFTHDTALSCLEDVRSNGLPTRGYQPYEIPENVKVALQGKDETSMLCLHPLGAKLRPGSSKQPPHIRLAIAANDLPKKVGLDWSYVPEIARNTRKANPNAAVGVVSILVADKLGSVSTYEGIQAASLRVWTKGASDDPSTWPLLFEANTEDIQTF